jgi:hypothetical protein
LNRQPNRSSEGVAATNRPVSAVPPGFRAARYSASGAAVAIAIALALRRGLARNALLARRALLAYVLVAVGCWLLPTPMGSNIARLGVAFALPLVLLARRRAPGAYVVVVGCAATAWLMFGPVTEVAKRLAAPGTHAAYFRPLLSQLERRARPTWPTATRWMRS